MGIRFRFADWLQRHFDRWVRRRLGGDRRPVFYDARETRPELLEIDAHIEEIQRELGAVLPNMASLPRYHDVDGNQTEIASEGSTEWRVFFVDLCWADESFPHRALCPRTAELTRRVPGFLQSFFSILEPGKNVPAHEGPGMHYLRYHTALRVPEKDPPSIRIRDEHYTWRQGESMLFDDSNDHEVMNRCEEARVVLITDFLRPLPWYLALVNRLMLLLRWPRKRYHADMIGRVTAGTPGIPPRVAEAGTG